jgi:hypothetical protein
VPFETPPSKETPSNFEKAKLSKRPSTFLPLSDFSVLLITIRIVLGGVDLALDIGKKQMSVECLNSSHEAFGDFIWFCDYDEHDNIVHPI